MTYSWSLYFESDHFSLIYATRVLQESPAFWRLFLRQKTSLNFYKVRSSCEDAIVGRKGNFLHTTVTFTFVEPEPGRAARIAAFSRVWDAPSSGMLTSSFRHL